MNGDALAEELAMQAIELRDSQGDPDGAALLDRAANWIARAVEALTWAEAALAPFSKEPAEKSGINMIREALGREGCGQ